MGPEDVEAIAALAYAEMLETGFTRVGEFHYLHHDRDGRPYADPAEMAARIAAAADASGIGLTLLPVFYAHAGFGGLEPHAGQARFVHGLDGFARLLEASRAAVSGLEDARVGVAPHSLRAVTANELTALVAMAGEGPIHIHIAEQVKEVEDCLVWCGQRPVDWLVARYGVDARWCLVHATHMTPGEIGRLARSGAVAGLCPITEANLGDGLFQAETFLEQGGRFGVGSDSNVLIDAAEELRTLEYGQRLTRRGRNLLAGAPGRSTGGDLFRGALAGGAQALGVEAGLAVGAPADIVSLDLSHPSLAGRSGDALLDSWIFGARGAVDGVWRRGRQVVSGGRHHARAGIEARYRNALVRLLA
jgi:formiminoglutamate deiminase